jgi:hypothetical protein
MDEECRTGDIPLVDEVEEVLSQLRLAERLEGVRRTLTEPGESGHRVQITLLGAGGEATQLHVFRMRVVRLSVVIGASGARG